MKKRLLISMLILSAFVISGCTIRNGVIVYDSKDNDSSDDGLIYAESEDDTYLDVSVVAVDVPDEAGYEYFITEVIAVREDFESTALDPVYVDFLCGEISFGNPYDNDIPLDIYTYQRCFTAYGDVTVEYALLDVNHDGTEELIVNAHNSTEQIVDVIGVIDGEAVLVDCFESHNSKIRCNVYDKGVLSYESFMMSNIVNLHTYDADNCLLEVLDFYKDSASQSELKYDCYFFDGNSDEEIPFTDAGEEAELILEYAGNKVEFVTIK